MSMKILSAILWIVGSVAWSQQAVTLAWDASPDEAHVAHYVVHLGEVSRGYVFSTNAGPSLTQRVVVPYPADWFFAVTAVGTNQLESDFSNEVMWRAPMGAPSMQGDTFVRLTPWLERSTNMVEWSPLKAVSTYVPTTNAMEFFRNKRLAIERWWWD